MKKFLTISSITLLTFVLMGAGCSTITSDEELAEDAEMTEEVSEDVDVEDEALEDSDQSEELAEDVQVSHTFNTSGWDFEFSMKEMVVGVGDTVTINFTSRDGFHDWVIDEFDAATARVKPEDGMTSVTFVADKAGEYEFYCGVGNHRAQGMVGTLTVE